MRCSWRCQVVGVDSNNRILTNMTNSKDKYSRDGDSEMCFNLFTMFDKPPIFQIRDLFQYILRCAGEWVRARMGHACGGVATASAHRMVTRVRPSGKQPRYTDNCPPGEKENAAPEPLIIFLLGPPGAGKGTQSALLKAAFPGLITHLSYGDLVRYQDRIPGSWVSSFPRRGGGSNNGNSSSGGSGGSGGGSASTSSNSPLVSADAAVHLLRDVIERGLGRYGQRVWLVDGFPRSAEHVAAWVAAAAAAAAESRVPLRARCAIHLSCPPEMLVQRVLERGRATQNKNGSDHSPSSSSPSPIRPEDADPRLVWERVERNSRESGALLRALEDADVRTFRVNADRDVEAVAQEIYMHVRVSLSSLARSLTHSLFLPRVGLARRVI